MGQNFIQNHWKGKLIKHSSAHITLADTMLDDSTRRLLEQVGLPVIMPSEEIISFLPFSHLSKFRDRDKDFYIMGDLSVNLSGIMLLGLEMQSGVVYAIRKARGQSPKFQYILKEMKAPQYLLKKRKNFNFKTTSISFPVVVLFILLFIYLEWL